MSVRRRREPVAFGFRIVLYLVYGLPLLWIVLTSLKSQSEVLSSQASLLFTPTFDAYFAAFADPQLGISMRQSAIIAVCTTVVCLAFAIPAAYALARFTSRIVVPVLALLVILQMIPQTANLIPLFWVLAQWGLLDTNLGLVLADASMLLPWAVLLLRPFFGSIPVAIDEASRIDGARTLRAFFSIGLPLARNGILTVSSIIFLVAWGEFLYGITFMLSPDKYPMSALIAQQAGAFGIDWPSMMAFAVVSSIPVFVVYVFSYRLLRTGLTLGAVK
ncbi:carbohydrate ABC transporter permease [Compostimonas suwonensis]|uniref:Multiple sugar transport system permease protein n=1 Tax=Compostimonas suwonensis TaxID=1048394 RepID=A0A2M9C3J2_9MICO|nr:carbohydrate ABC transporter permease [Compostimonas suwonensis]PJJ65086.1 multiple sugar transport system permease protein [Compostimonas suwonensis]